MAIIFFSGNHGTAHDRARLMDVCRGRLQSCHGSYFSLAKQWLAEAHTHPLAKERYIMLDSGAFTAWTLGEKMTLQMLLRAYGSLVDRFAPYFKKIYLINLDVIPGRYGVTPTQEEREEAKKGSDENFAELYKRFGDVVMPVYHFGEGKERLLETAAQNPSILCLGGSVGTSDQIRVPWAQRVHQIIPGHPTHGLGMTGTEAMLEIPWYSVDSSSWIQTGVFGYLLLPTKHRGLMRIAISSDSPKKRVRNQHYDNATPDIKLIVENYADKVGVTIEDLHEKPAARCFFNLNAIQEVGDRPKTMPAVQDTLWGLS